MVHSKRTTAAAKVSAIIPTYNSGDLLDRCLAALDAADEVDDVIVLDGGSTDGCDERARERGVRVLRMDGTSFCRRLNEGMAQARNDLVLILNDDAFVDPATPARLAEVLRERSRVAVAGARLRWEDGRDQRSGGRYKTLTGSILSILGLRPLARRVMRPPIRPEPEGSIEQTDWVPLSAGLVRKAAFEEVGGFDERFSFYAQDQDFAHKLKKAGWGTVLRSDAGAVHVKGGSTKRKRPGYWFVQYHQNRFVYLQKWYPRAWRLYAVPWAVRASVHMAVWRARALRRRLRGDHEGEEWAREWAEAFRGSRRPVSARRPGEVEPG